MTHPKAEGYYQATAEPSHETCQPLGDCHVDVAIVGAGYTGLSTALELARRGVDVVVLEAETVAFGASGRNGGQVSTGQRRPQDEIEQRYGHEAAQALWALAEEAKTLVKEHIAANTIDCDLKSGIVEAAHNRRNGEELKAYPEFLQRHYGYEALSFHEGQDFQTKLNSPDYACGTYDADAVHLHPLKYAFGLARAAQKAGARIIENCRVKKLKIDSKARLSTPFGVVTADKAVLACNGYLDNLMPSVARRIMPLNNFILATEPLGERADQLIPSDAAVADTRFVINYFKLSADRRLLFGGGETYGFRFPSDIGAFVRPHMLNAFPNLENCRIDYAWGGTLAITRPRLPLFCRPAPRVLSAGGYSGHGVSIATLAGKLLAEDITAERSRFDIMAQIDPPTFPGGTSLRLPLLWLAMAWYRIRDRL